MRTSSLPAHVASSRFEEDDEEEEDEDDSEEEKEEINEDKVKNITV